MRRETMPEHEGYALLERFGIGVARHRFLPTVAAAGELDLDEFAGDRVVLKVCADGLAHKSDVGGVRVVAREARAVADGLRSMRRDLAGVRPEGFLVCEFVEHENSPWSQLLVGARWTDDFGPVVGLGPGGMDADFLTARLDGGRGALLLPAAPWSEGAVRAALGRRSFVRAATGATRARRRHWALEELGALLGRVAALARQTMPATLDELEINPLVATVRGPVALDVLARPGRAVAEPAPPRPLGKLARLLRPRTIAIAGVSERVNPGRIILENVLRAGFERDRIVLIKPGRDELAGCRCVADIDALPEGVDLLVLSIVAEQVPGSIDSVIAGRRAESVIVIPGGMGERSGTEDIERAVRAALAGSRAEDWEGPLVNGGNCLGIRSRPGRYDTLFVPRHKLGPGVGRDSPLALISQSGAFCVATASKLAAVGSRYLISVGNQIDLTVGDYLTGLADDPDLAIFACYVEGFRPLDGARWLAAARRIVESGGVVLLYRAGRTRAGVSASASHTASIAGDYEVTRELARAAGVVVADTLADFEDLIRLFCLLRGKSVDGRRLTALSNAGFESVAIADNLRGFTLAPLSGTTVATVEAWLERFRLGGIVRVANPLDVTPILDDEAFASVAAALLEDEGADVGVIGCVPLTGALETLPAGTDHEEDIEREGSVAQRLIRLHARSRKAWVAVVDSGAPYDPMASALERGGVPTFRNADRAMRLFDRYCGLRMLTPPGRPTSVENATGGDS